MHEIKTCGMTKMAFKSLNATERNDDWFPRNAKPQPIASIIRAIFMDMGDSFNYLTILYDLFECLRRGKSFRVSGINLNDVPSNT